MAKEKTAQEEWKEKQDNVAEACRLLRDGIKDPDGRKKLAKMMMEIVTEELIGTEHLSDDGLCDALETIEFLTNAARALMGLPLDPGKRERE